MSHLLRFALLLAVSTPALANDLAPPEKVGLSSDRLDRLTLTSRPKSTARACRVR